VVEQKQQQQQHHQQFSIHSTFSYSLHLPPMKTVAADCWSSQHLLLSLLRISLPNRLE
jgi:hypothetical protein